MKITEAVSLHPAPDEFVAKFGLVHLVRKADGRHDLTGGTAVTMWSHKEARLVVCIQRVIGAVAPQFGFCPTNFYAMI